MQRIWGWSYLEKCFFLPIELAKKEHACMRESWETFHWSLTNLELLFVISVHFIPGFLKTGLAKISTHSITWDQALFSFRFENYIPAGKAKRKENLIQTFYETSAESANQNYFRCLFFLVCKFFIRGKNADSLTWKIAFLFKFFQLKLKRSAQSHLTSCESKGDLERYFCWRRR